MTEAIEFWKNDSDGKLWANLSKYKELLVESKVLTEFNETMARFYQVVDNKIKNGAALFAVCRGKVSEGIDFSDARGRAVVITGLPFAPKDDPKLVLKQNYLEAVRKEGFAEVERAEIETRKAKALGPALFNEATRRLILLKKDAESKPSGSSWYTQQAHRSVNQAMGRVIRHKDDWGAVLLLDERFATENKSLCAWLRRFVTIQSDFASLHKNIFNFFKNAKSKYGSGIESEQKAIVDLETIEGAIGGIDEQKGLTIEGRLSASSVSSWGISVNETMEDMRSSSFDIKQSAHDKARKMLQQLQKEHAIDQGKEEPNGISRTYKNEDTLEEEPRSLSSILQTKSLAKKSEQNVSSFQAHSRPISSDLPPPPPTKIQKLNNTEANISNTFYIAPLEIVAPLKDKGISSSSSSSSSNSNSNSKAFLSSLKTFLGSIPFGIFYSRLMEEKQRMKGGEKIPRSKITELMDMLSNLLTTAAKTLIQQHPKEDVFDIKVEEAEALLRRFAQFFPSAEAFAQHEVEAFAYRLREEIRR
jgi:hypothetical protein